MVMILTAAGMVIASEWSALKRAHPAAISGTRQRGIAQMNAEDITLLVRESSKIEECLTSVDRFRRAQSKIRVILLGAAPQLPTDGRGIRLGPLRRSGVEFYTDTPGPMASFGVHVVNQSEIAALLAHTDVVIPL
jgi:hypothetical protein